MAKYGKFPRGETPKDVVLKALRDDLGDNWYPMTLSGSDQALVTKIVNVGIDAHLEAITDLRQGRETGNITGNRLNLEFGHDSLCVLLRRLNEVDEQDEDDNGGEAGSLRADILSGLGIEEG